MSKEYVTINAATMRIINSSRVCNNHLANKIKLLINIYLILKFDFNAKQLAELKFITLHFSSSHCTVNNDYTYAISSVCFFT